MGPVAVEETEPSDVLEVQIRKIDIDADCACNRLRPHRGFCPWNFLGHGAGGCARHPFADADNIDNKAGSDIGFWQRVLRIPCPKGIET
jgi:hypothetical protein